MTTGTRIGVVSLAIALAGCGDFPPIEESQTGFRGTSMMLVEDEGELAADVDSAAAAIPELPPPPEAGDPAPPGTWQNVQVLNDVSEEEFFWLMNAMTQWVSPQEGCAYCHVPSEEGLDLVSDDNYAKVVSRRMIQMTRYINEEWPSHVREGGINCYACHRGNPVPPAGNWYFTDRNQVERYYLDRPDARVQDPDAALATNSNNRSSLKQTEWTYKLMLTMSGSLGVNCTYCHQSSRFGDWESSTAARTTALRGARMTRALNQDYLVPLQDEWPPERLGPRGDGPKLQCVNCHQGAYRPLYGSPAVHAVESLYPRGEGTDQTAADTAASATAPDGSGTTGGR